MNKKVIVFCAATAVCANVAFGQKKEKVQRLEEVVITDSRFELKRENSGKTVIKITQEELQHNQGKTISEIINTKSGFSIAGANSRDGVVLGVFARGGRGRQVLILVDGVRVSDPSSINQEYDLRLLSIANVESIEIIKGASSTLYGTNAATAVINITTKQASEEHISGSFQASVGTNQTTDDQDYHLNDFTNSAQLSGTVSKFTYAVGFANRYSDGLSAIETPTNEKDDFSNYSTNVDLGYNFADRIRLRLYGNHTKIRTQFDESFGMFDAPYEFFSVQKRAGTAFNYGYNNGELVLNAGFSNYVSETVSAFPNTYEGTNLVVDLYNKYNFNDRFYTILGVNYIKDETEYAETQDFTIIDPYANVVYVSDYGLNVNAGFRLNNHSEYGSHIVYNVNPSFRFYTAKGYLKLLGSYATSYITPSLNQLFGNFGANPGLEPEKNTTIEGGVEFAGNNDFRISALYFNRKEENFVFYGANGYENAQNNIDANGVEVNLDYSLANNLNLSANYTLTERKGDNAIRLPKHKVNATLGYNFSERTNTSLSYQLTGKRTDTDFGTFPSTDVDLDAFSLVNFHISHQLLKDKLTAFISANNLLNTEYTEILGFTTKGRNIRLGLNLNLY